MKKSSGIAHRIIDNEMKDILDEIGVNHTRRSLNPFFPNRVALAVSKGAAERSHKASGSGAPFCEQPSRVVQIAGNNSSESFDESRRRIFDAVKDVVSGTGGISKVCRFAFSEKSTLGGAGESAIRNAILDMVDGFGFPIPKQVSLAYHISKARTPAKISGLLRSARLHVPPRAGQPVAGIFLPPSDVLLWRFEDFNFRTQHGVVRTQDTTRETSNTYL